MTNKTKTLIASAAIPRLDAVRLGWPVLIFCLGAASVAGLLAGLLPAWRRGTIRVSFGRSNTREAARQLANEIARIVEKLRTI